VWLGRPPGRRSDIYALGLVLWELLAGELPQAGLRDLDLIHAITSLQLPPLADIRPDVPAPLADLIDRCVARQPKDRMRSAAELRDRLEVVRSVYAPLIGDLDDDEATQSKGADRV